MGILIGTVRIYSRRIWSQIRYFKSCDG